MPTTMCTNCDGTGDVDGDDCFACDGTGEIETDQEENEW